MWNLSQALTSGPWRVESEFEGEKTSTLLRGLSMPFKLDHHHRITVQKLFTHPLCHNIQWHDVCSLLVRFGEVFETHRGNWAVTIDGETTSFGSVRSRDLTEDQVVKVRHVLCTLRVTKVLLQSA